MPWLHINLFDFRPDQNKQTKNPIMFRAAEIWELPPRGCGSRATETGNSSQRACPRDPTILRKGQTSILVSQRRWNMQVSISISLLSILQPPDAKKWLIEKDPDAGEDWRQEEKGTWGGWMTSLTRWTWVLASSGSWWWTGKSGVLQSMGLQSQTWLSNWTELTDQDFRVMNHDKEDILILKLLKYPW